MVGSDQTTQHAATMAQRQQVVSAPRVRGHVRRRMGTILLYVIALIMLVIMVSPYVFLFLQSLAPWDQVNRSLIPTSLTLRSYDWLRTGGSYGEPLPWVRAFLNSMFVTVTDTISMVAVAAIVGYALSILRFRGRKVINNFILFQMFYPGIILLVPTFLIIRTAGLYNTYPAMIIPKLVSLWAIFMYTGFYRSIPDNLVEAARIDGAGDLRIVFSLMVPMSRSITTVIFLFLFMERWVELLWDLLVIKDQTRQTLNVLLATMFGPYGSFPGPLYAAGVLLTFPILLLFIVFSRRFVEGVHFVLR
jgi:multiple sugar transport system permease protein